MIKHEIESHGRITIVIQIEKENREIEEREIEIKNKVLRSGRTALALSLANQFGGNFNFFVTRVLFGGDGTVGGVPRFIDDARDGLFGTTLLSKPVLATINPDFPTKVTFTTVVAFNELVGQTINEMALEMASGDIFSMATFGDINKSSTMQLTYGWSLYFI